MGLVLGGLIYGKFRVNGFVVYIVGDVLDFRIVVFVFGGGRGCGCGGLKRGYGGEVVFVGVEGGGSEGGSCFKCVV